MKLCRFDADRLGLVEGETIVDVSAALEVLPATRWPLPRGDALIAQLDRLRPAIEDAAKHGRRVPVAGTRLLSPIANPLLIVGIGINYRDHAEEAQKDAAIAHGRTYDAEEDVVQMFIKASSAVVGPSEGVELRFLDRRNDHEMELAVVIGREGTDIPKERALDHVAGYCIGLDMTLRGPETPSSRKGIESYCVLGPWFVTRDEIPNPDALDIRLAVNGETRQNSNTRTCRFNVARLVHHASTFYRLRPGDVILTSTPAGVSAVHPGDTMSCEIERIGQMSVAIRAH